MGEPNKDLEKGQLHPESDSHSLGEGITSAFSKAGEGLTSALSKAGEGILSAGSAMKEAANPKPKKSSDQKKNPHRAKAEKKFHKHFKPTAREEPKDTNIVGNITKLLPANTFLMFQTLAPLATNDGNCGRPEIIMTSIMLIILASTCMLVCFTDTIQFNGKVYHGVVTWSGLWNPSFKGDPAFIDLRTYELKLAQFYQDRRHYKADKRRAAMNGLPIPARPEEPSKPNGPHVMGSTYSSGNSQYQLKFTDFLHAVLSAMAFCTLTMLTSPVSTCFYPDIPSTVVKTLPLLVGFVISAIFAFSPPARNGIAHPLSPKVHSVTDNYKPPDPKGVVHGPSLPPKPPGKGKPESDDDDDDGTITGSAKRILGKLFNSSDRDDHSPNHREHAALEGVKSITSELFHKYEDEIKGGVAKLAHTLGDEGKKEGHHLLSHASSGSSAGVASKELYVPTLAQIQEIAKSPHAESLMAGLMSVAGAGHPALAAAAHAAQSAYTQGAKDAVLQIHQDIQTATSAPLAGRSQQSSMMLSRAGSSLSLPSVHDDSLFHQAAQALQNSGLVTHGADAANITQALLQAGLHPGAALSPQAHALSAFNLNAASALVKDGAALVQQSGKSWTEVHDELARQQSGFSQGLNAQLQTLYSPAKSVAHNLTGLGSQTLNQIQEQRAAISQGTFAANLASAAARETGTLLLVGADHGMAGVRDELARKQAAAVQGVTQPASSLAQDVTSVVQQGAQAASEVHGDVMKQKAALVEEVNAQVRALNSPATSVAQDIAELRKAAPGSLAVAGDEASQKLIDGVNSQFAATLARSMARGMSMRMHAIPPVPEQFQPAASVATDVASFLQQGRQMHDVQLVAEQAALSQGFMTSPMQVAFSQGMIDPTQVAAQQVVETHLRRLTSLAPQPPNLTAALLSAAPVTTNTIIDSRPVQQMQNVTGRVIEDAMDAVATGQALVTAAPSVSQMRTEVVASTSDALAAASARLRRDQRPESTEITDSISVEEITSESETEGRGRHDRFRAGDPGSSSNPVRKM